MRVKTFILSMISETVGGIVAAQIFLIGTQPFTETVWVSTGPGPVPPGAGALAPVDLSGIPPVSAGVPSEMDK